MCVEMRRTRYEPVAIRKKMCEAAESAAEQSLLTYGIIWQIRHLPAVISSVVVLTLCVRVGRYICSSHLSTLQFRHLDIQSTEQKSYCVNTTFWPSQCYVLIRQSDFLWSSLRTAIGHDLCQGWSTRKPKDPKIVAVKATISSSWLNSKCV